MYESRVAQGIRLAELSCVRWGGPVTLLGLVLLSSLGTRDGCTMGEWGQSGACEGTATVNVKVCAEQCSNLRSVRWCSSVWYSVCTYVRSVRRTYALYAGTKQREQTKISFPVCRPIGEKPGPVECIFARVTARDGVNSPCQQSTAKDGVTLRQWYVADAPDVLGLGLIL